MSTYVVVGLQYGDEGKGKITDVLSAKSDYVVRFQGGDNAGHTVYAGEEKFVLHLLPSGVLQCQGKCIIANGVVVNPKAFMKEIGQLEAKGMRTDHVFISRRAHERNRATGRKRNENRSCFHKPQSPRNYALSYFT